MTRSMILMGLVVGMFSASATAITVPFTEDFVFDEANWRNATLSAELGWSATGGPDGGSYASGTFNFVNSAVDDTPAVLRGQEEFNFSGNAFVGDWITDNITLFTVQVRHDAPTPLSMFTRFSSQFNFPGAIALSFAPVLPNTWTEIAVPIDPSNPQFITFEGSNFANVFDEIGHVQVGVIVPAALAGVDANYSFSIDKVSIVPAPAAIWPLAAGLLVLARRSRRAV